MYPNQNQKTIKKKAVIVVALLVLVAIAVAIVSSLGKSSTRNTLSDDPAFSTYKNSIFSISYPKELSQEPDSARFILKFTPQGASAPDKISVLPFLSKDSQTNISTIENLYTQNGLGQVIYSSKKGKISGRPAIELTPTNKTSASLSKNMYVEGDKSIWLIEASYSSAESILAKNIDDVFKSFRLVEGS